MKRQWKSGLILAFAVFATVLFGLLDLPSTASAANPQTVSFQGKVVNADGTNVTDGSYSFLFKLYTGGTASGGGSQVWTETQTVTVSAGIFQVDLGSSCSFFTAATCNGNTPIAFNTITPLYLSMTFNNDVNGEMLPRVQLQSVPFAFNSDRVGGFTADQLAQLSPGTQQTGFINVSGSGRFDGGLTVNGGAVSINSSGANNAVLGGATGTLTLGGAAAGNILIQTAGTLTVTAPNFSVTSAGVATASTGIKATTGAINAVGGTIQTNTTDRIDNGGNLVNIGTIAAAGGKFTVNASGDQTAVATALDGTSTTTGNSGFAGATSTSLALTSAANFDVGNYVQVNDTNCGGTGVNPCYAKITAKAGNTLTITPALLWTAGKTVNEYHFAEIGATDLTQPLANRYGRGYFIAGVATGNGTTYYSEDSITSSLSSFDLLNTGVTTLNIGSAANTISIGNAATVTNIAGGVMVTGTAGLNSGTGVLQGTGGLTLTGTTSINGTGSSATTIGSASAGAVSIQSGSTFAVGATNLTITAAGAITAASTVTGTTINGTTGLSTGAGAGTQRIDASGNHVNAGNYTAAAGATFSTTGANGFTFKPGTNNATSFQVDNAAGAALLNVSSSGNNSNNLLVNPSIEAAISGNWTAKGSASVTQDSTQQYSGNNSLNIAATGANGGATQAVALTTGATYSFAVYVRLTSTNMSSFEIGYSNDGTTDSPCITNQTVYRSGWARISCSFTTGTVSGTPYIYAKQLDATARSIYLDAATLETVVNTTTNYHEGQISLQANIASPVVIQNATNTTTAFQVLSSKGANVLTVGTVDANLLAGSAGFETSALGYTYSGTPGSVVRDSSMAYTGSYSMKVTTSANANNGLKFTFANATPAIPLLAVSTTYTISWYDQLSSGTFTDIIAAYARDGTNEVSCTGINTQIVSIGGWTRHSCQITTDATAPAANAYLVIKQVSGVARTFNIDSVQLEQGSIATSYGAGSVDINATIMSPVAIRPTSNSTTAFQIQNASGANVFAVDSLNGMITANASILAQRTGTGAALIVDRSDGVIGSLKAGSAKIAFFFDSAGSFALSTDTRANISTGSGSGTDVLTVSNTGNIVAAGSIAATTTVTGTTVNGTTGLNTGAGVGTQRLDASGNLVNIGNYTSAAGSTFSTTGATGFAFKPGTNNSTAFQIQKADGTPLFAADTTTVNLLTNPGFELGITGWTARGSSTLSQNLVTTNAYHGIASLKAVTTAANSGATTNAFTQTVAAGTYTLSFYIKNSLSIATLRAGYNQGAADVACTPNSTTLIIGGFQRYSCTFTSSANLSYIYVDAGANTATTMYIDGVQLQAGTAATAYQIGSLQLRGIITNPLSLQSSSDSTTAFQVQNAAGTATTFAVDTVNGRANASTGFSVAGVNGSTVAVCTASQYLGAAKLTGGILTAGTCTNDATGLSDVRLKTNIVQLRSALEGIKNLKTYTFNYKCNDPEYASLNLSCDLQTGVIAQELQQYFPNLVSQRDDGYYQVDYRGLSVETLNAVGELARNVDAIAAGTTPSGAVIANSLTSNGALSIDSGASGDVTIDSGGNSAYVKIGADKAAGVSISHAGALTDVAGALTVNESANFTGPVTMNFAEAQNLKLGKDLTIDNSSADTAVDTAIKVNNTGGAGFTNIISTDNFTVTGSGDVLAKNFTGKNGSFQLLDATGANVVTIDNGGNANFKGNLNLSSAALSGGLTVGGDVTVAGLSTFQKLATFIGKTVFRQDVQFDGHLTVTKDGAGYATLRATETTVRVKFHDDYTTAPVVSATITNGKFAAYTIDHVDTKGFDISLKDPAAEDTSFSWTAIGVNDPQTATNPLPVTP